MDNTKNNFLEKIDKYLMIKEKNDVISMSLNSDNDLNDDIIEMVRNSEDREKAISMFNEEMQIELRKLQEGGII